MHKKIKNILEKYSHINFSYQDDRDIFLEFVGRIGGNIKNDNIADISTFAQILEYNFLEYSKFDTKILYNPVELIGSIIESDILGKKIDDSEYKSMLERMFCFKKYLDGDLEDRDFLEKKYGITITLVKNDIGIYPTGIYARGLGDYSEKLVIKKLKNHLNRYPINFIKNIKLDSIIVVSSFYKRDVYGAKLHLGGFETDGDNNVYLSESNLTAAFDHEVYHQAMQYYDDRHKWKKIRKKQAKKYLYKNLDKQVFGFARNYGKENISEDQATVAEELILNYSDLSKRILSDRRLKLKVELVKKAYFYLSEGIMNEKWWRENTISAG